MTQLGQKIVSIKLIINWAALVRTDLFVASIFGGGVLLFPLAHVEAGLPEVSHELWHGSEGTPSRDGRWQRQARVLESRQTKLDP